MLLPHNSAFGRSPSPIFHHCRVVLHHNAKIIEVIGCGANRPHGLAYKAVMPIILPVVCPLLITPGQCAKFGCEGLEDLTDL